mmetsp:Transcript_80638/g.111686  ORF Transcript_80638/g.111686 Transcript_80638/m.111686 type:complete len:130 (-) Transcript_80638:123-512(-)
MNPEVVDILTKRINRYHPFFKRFELLTCRLLFANSKILKVIKDQVLYTQGEYTSERFYIILLGKFDHKGYLRESKDFDTVGSSFIGESFGEEGLFELGVTHRKESALAMEDSFLVEVTKQDWKDLQGAC